MVRDPVAKERPDSWRTWRYVHARGHIAVPAAIDRDQMPTAKTANASAETPWAIAT